MQGIYSEGHDGEGLARVYENKAWMVGIKNWKKANDAEFFTEIERHRETDELFLLLSGSCVLLSALDSDLHSAFEEGGVEVEKEGGDLRFVAESMKPGQLYVIPAKLWHTTITRPGAKLALVEDPGTGAANSDVRVLSSAELDAARKAIAAAP
jgi:hypothetical protein